VSRNRAGDGEGARVAFAVGFRGIDELHVDGLACFELKTAGLFKKEGHRGRSHLFAIL
jgi:hypothetical protein